MRFFIYFLLIIFVTLSYCSKRSSAVPPQEKEQEQEQEEDPETDDSTRNTPHIIEMGTGSGGQLIIDGREKTFPPHTVIRIKGGSYSSIEIKYISGTEDSPVRIENEGLIESSGELYLRHLNYVIISGKGTQGIEKGFIFKDNPF